MVVVEPEEQPIDRATRSILRHKNLLRRRATDPDFSEHRKGRRLNIFLCLQGLNLETGFGFYTY